MIAAPPPDRFQSGRRLASSPQHGSIERQADAPLGQHDPAVAEPAQRGQIVQRGHALAHEPQCIDAPTGIGQRLQREVDGSKQPGQHGKRRFHSGRAITVSICQITFDCPAAIKSRCHCHSLDERRGYFA